MNKKQLIIAIFSAFIIGTLMHFTYEWSGSPHFAGYIFPVDETVWEHMKIVFYPMLFSGIYMAILKKDIGAASSMILTGIAAIPLIIGLFYSYWYFTRRSILTLDLIIYYGVLALAIIFGNRWNKSKTLKKLWPLFLLCAVAMAFLFALLTYNRPKLPYFLFRYTKS